MEEETNQEIMAADPVVEEAKKAIAWARNNTRKERNAAKARERTARLRALGLSARGKPLKDRHKNRDTAKQLKYQANFSARHKAARERLGLTIAEFNKLPRAVRAAEYNKLKHPAQAGRAIAKVTPLAQQRPDNGAAAYQINECPNCGCPIRALTVALKFEEDRKHGVQ